MFKSLKRKFLLLNFVSISLLLLLAFTALFVITYQNVKHDITVQLEQIVGESTKRPMTKPSADDFSNQRASKFPSISFTVTLDDTNQYQLQKGPFQLETSELTPLIENATNSNATKSYFSEDGQYWAFQKYQTYTNESKIAFVNITNSVTSLFNLIYTSILVSLALLVVIVIISKYYAKRAIAPIQQAFHQQEEFIANASHELKTPLTIINTSLNIIRNNPTESVAKQDKWLTYIQTETNRMSTLTTDLLYLTKMEQDDNSIALSTFSLNDALTSCLLPMEAIAFEKNIAITSKLCDVSIHGHYESIQKLFYILIDNAIKYTNENGYIHITMEQAPKKVILHFKNSSKAIDKDTLDRVFDRFYRIDDSRNRTNGGYGIGLSIAKTIVTRHHGEITANHTNGETCFSVLLPIA